MNFLAHIYLSFDHEKLMIGNFIGDFVKGNQLEDYEEEIKLGITLHRSIDEYTDNHSTVLTSKQRLRRKYRHYAGVIVDVFYDHFLAQHWEEYHSTSLPDFIRTTYKTLNDYSRKMPRGAQFMLPHMIDQNWLLHYGQVDGIDRALTGMSRRTKFDSKMDQASNDLRYSYEEFEYEFNCFFPDAIAFSKNWIERELK